MANPGINIKLRRVQNGYTIHLTDFNLYGVETHRDYVETDKAGVLDTVRGLVEDALDNYAD